jgi:spore germination protein GerM
MSVRRAAATGLVLLVAGCGLPGTTEVRAVDATAVPYNLLDPEAQSRPGQIGPVPVGTPVVFWLVHDDRLAPTAVPVSCSDPVDDVLSQQLALLAAAPDEVARAAGRSSTIPSSSQLELVDVADGVATVEFDPATSLTADRLPLAMGQLVLTVTSAPGIEAVQVSAAGDTVEVPLPDGALTERPVSANDYAILLPERFLGSGRRGLSTDIGCPTPDLGSG